MALSPGTRLGPYEIVSPLGAGGMGEIYRAKDTRLDRSVAVKVLSEHLSASADVRQRFEREAKAISSLQHPHICTLYDVGREGETDFLVMELLEGESLSDRLLKGPLPIEEVLRLGIQIADALEKAHAAGIVHRDLKPGNVFVTDRGVKLLDFGLAKLHATSPHSTLTQLGQLPTEQHSAPLTSAGMILGTFQYMSPEQLEGREADARSDLFALGCVLYEMATGKKAFTGTSQASLIGSIMSGTPAPVSASAPLSPPALDRLIATCLAKDPKDRWHTAHDVRLQLAWIAEGGSQLGIAAPVAQRRRNRERLAWAVAAVLAVAAGVATAGYLRRAPVPPRVARFEIPQPAKLLTVGEPKLSPDGRHIAFVGVDEKGQGMVWLRSIDSIEARPIAGTEGTTVRARPFWSPDSRFLAFIAEGSLKKVPIDGGPAQKICDAPTGADGSWSEDGTILFDGQTEDPILRVPAAGGLAKPILEKVDGADGYKVAWPQFLPGGEQFLFVSHGGEEGQNGIRIANADGSDSRRVIEGLSRVEYAPPGYLIFVRDSTLVAQRFDVEAAQLVGEPIPIADGLGVRNNGQAEFSVSRQGVLVYRAGKETGVQLVWLDRRGTRVDPPVETGDLYNPSLSADGRWLATQRGDSKGDDLWLRDLRRGVSSRLTFVAGDEWTPLLSPDGQTLLYSRDDEGDKRTILSRSLESGAEKEIFTAPRPSFPVAISSDGKNLLFALEEEGVNIWDLWRLPLAGGAQAIRYAAAPGFHEYRASFSPDGRWVAFQSNESGRSEIYVQAFPTPGRKWQISTAGGIEPVWSHDGREIFYVSPADSRLARVEVRIGAAFDAGIPEFIFPLPLAPQLARNRYLLSPDGQRFLVVAPAGEGQTIPTTVVLGWDAALGR